MESNNETATIKLDLTHVWTVDGEALGIRHELELDGDHVIARDVGIKYGRQHGPAHERRIPLIQAVHVLLNATGDELAAIENRFVESSCAEQVPLTDIEYDPFRAHGWQGMDGLPRGAPPIPTLAEVMAHPLQKEWVRPAATGHTYDRGRFRFFIEEHCAGREWDPITMLDGKVVDGHHRLAAAILLNLPTILTCRDQGQKPTPRPA